ncbi:rod shape-determining protein MreC [Xenorhabdus vietnamensis]|uniref:Cell shape-determining protein MreC n=1 Tax=Xenorhabdus vietnamensis TaxID=351656 RepID=A0A1Y2SFV0_9GAMM|nr:rod shape-determining protein MreC [Xenorhabdus vietnamensis]OTA17491.1 rod shape-determining protein MreC [Xenorhabdus vietnamensis]
MKPIFSRGPSLQLRLFFAIVIAIILIVVDSRLGIFHKVRSYMDTAVSPFYFLANGPRQLLDSISESMSRRSELELANTSLRNKLLIQDSKLLLLGQLQQENSRLRELLASPLLHNEHMMVSQVISGGMMEPYRAQVVLDKGAKDGVYEGQPVISDRGVVGQVTAVNQFSSRILLICDPSHALPVQVLRNDIRAIAGGTGCTDDLLLEPLQSNVDIRVGDVLVTSGLGGRFPEGYPVAVVSSVKIDNQRAQAVIHARASAELQRLRYLLLLWGVDNNPSNPLPPEKVSEAANERLIPLLPKASPNSLNATQQLATQSDEAKDGRQVLSTTRMVAKPTSKPALSATGNQQ